MINPTKSLALLITCGSIFLVEISCFSQDATLSTSRKAKKSWVAKWLDRSFIDIGLFLPFENENTSKIDLTTSQIQFSKNLDLMNGNSIGIHSNYNYSLLAKKLSIGLTASSTLVGFSNIKIGFDYHKKIALKDRVIYLSPGLGFSSFRHYLPLTSVQGPLTLNGREFGGPIIINMEKNSLGIQANLRLAVSLNKLFDFFVSSNYLIGLSQKEYIYFAEKTGSKGYFQNISSPDVQLLVNGSKAVHWPFELNPFFVTIGISNKLK